MNRIIFSFSLLITCGSMAFAQESAIAAANKLYNAQAYAEAIPKYERVMKKDSNNAIVLSKLGDCYRFTNNTKGEYLCYSKLITSGKAEPIHKLYLGQALMGLGKYEEAKKMMEEFSGDDRGKTFSKSIDNLKAFSKNEDAYRVDTVSFNSNENDFSPVFFAGTRLVFTSSRKKTSWISHKHGWTGADYYGLYTTELQGNGKYQKPKVFMKDLQSKYNDGPISFSKDGRTVYFTRNNAKKKKGASKDGTFKLKIYEAALNVDGFERVKELPFNNPDYNCAHPAISADGNTLYFASDMEGGQGGLDLYVSKKGADGAWGGAVNLGDKINTKGHEMFPFVNNEGLLFFASNGRDGLGGLDIYEVKFKDEKPGKVYNMGRPINTKADDFGILFSDDSKTGYFSSNRKNGGLDDDIYVFSVLRPVKRGKEVILQTRDKDSSTVVVPFAVVKSQLGDSIQTNEKGEYTYFIEEDTYYTLTANKPKYFTAQDSLSTKMSDQDEFTKTILLEKDPDLSLVAVVTDVKSKQPLDGVKITIKENPSGSNFDEFTTAITGDYKKALPGKKIGDKISYKITLEKQGYVTKTLDFDHVVKKPGEIKMQELMDMSIGRALVGMDIAKLIDIKPIYFDLGKSKIRKDAALELDKVVQVMKEYPNIVVELGAHTDCRSPAAANLKLSTARAKASASYITSKGIPRDRITGKGYGESKLLNSCACEGKKVTSNCTEEDHALNRRTEFIITKLKEPKKPK
jgi:outer membrane protein OmpA-like peptidoglycan-associated protein